MARTPSKSDGAFRTIREVADWLGVPTHVLRFWESKFDQIAPVKGAGGRRYYRPEDMRLLGGIKVMLHDQGLTIRAVSQKIDEDGTDPVMDLAPELDMPDAAARGTRKVIREGGSAPKVDTPPEPLPDPDPLPEIVRDAAPDRPQPIEPGTDPEIEHRPAADIPTAPSDGADLLPDQPDDAGDMDLPGLAPAPPPAEVVEIAPPPPALDIPPGLALLRSVRGARLSPDARPKARRLRRRLTALAEELADDLAHGAGR